MLASIQGRQRRAFCGVSVNCEIVPEWDINVKSADDLRMRPARINYECKYERDEHPGHLACFRDDLVWVRFVGYFIERGHFLLLMIYDFAANKFGTSKYLGASSDWTDIGNGAAKLMGCKW